MYIYSIIIQFCISDTTKRLQRYNFFFVSFNIYRKMRNLAHKFTTKMNKTAQHMLLYSSIFIIIIGISLFLLAVVLALTVFVAIKKYEHYKHRRLSRKHRRRHVVKVKVRGKTYFIGENEHFLKEKRKKCRKNLVISNKSITFALAFEI